jgi:hypothetical protein
LRIWNEFVAQILRYYPGFCPKGLRKKGESVSNPGWDVNQAALKYVIVMKLGIQAATIVEKNHI